MKKKNGPFVLDKIESSDFQTSTVAIYGMLAFLGTLTAGVPLLCLIGWWDAHHEP